MSLQPTRTILHAFSTFKLGGPQARFVALANHFGAQYRHIIVAMDNQFAAADLLEPQVDYELMPLTVQKGGAFANRAAFRQILRNLQPDLVLSYNWGAIEWALANVPQLCPHWHVEDGFGPEEAQQQITRRVVTRRILFRLSKISMVVPSRLLFNIANHIWHIPAKKLQFIANGVALPVVAKSFTKTGPVTIGTVAAIRKEKNIVRLVRAFAAVKSSADLRLLIVGDGPELDAVKSLVNDLGLTERVIFTGYQKKPTELLEQFDLFALSSDTEQLPIAMLEAMAAGLPVIATEVGDVLSIFANSPQAFTAKVTDADFTAVLQRAIESREQWPAIGANNRLIIADNFQVAIMQARWQQLFETGTLS